MTTTNEKRARAISAEIADQVSNVVFAHFAEVEKAALDSDSGENDKPIIAKITIAACWSAGANPAKVSTKYGWTTKHTDEAEGEVDVLQMPIKYEGGTDED